MSRLGIFCLFLTMLEGLFSLKSYMDHPVNKERFDIAKAEADYKAHVAQMKELEEMRKPKIKVVEEVVVEGPLVVLDTPELERGSKLYAKCIVCHGRKGEGKKAQNAPKLGGQHAWYIENQLAAMKSGERINKVMLPYLKKLGAQEFKDLGIYISKLPAW